MAAQGSRNPSHVTFDQFVQANTCQEAKRLFSDLLRQLQLNPSDCRNVYSQLKERLNYWKAKDLWAKFDSRASQALYEQGKVCSQNKCLVLGAGPCGLRTAIELSLLGARVVVLEKRKEFTRNNVLHLWPFTIYDLRELGAKKFHGKFCSGSLDHISIRQLQLILLKVCLLLGVEVHTGVEYKGLLEPSGEHGWMAKLQPASHPAAAFQFDVFISAGGGRLVPDGFKHKELRGRLAIGITANFINSNTVAEAQVAEISGVARIYNQKFFQQLLADTGIDLENIVYYKDETHYFVMTAKRKSLLQRGVIKQDYSNSEQLLSPANVDVAALRLYARDAANFSTGGKLPQLQFAQNHVGQPDVAMFDFTCMHRAENASMVRERRGHKLLMALVGDCLVEPFWPLGTGVARGFLASLDTAWTVRSWGQGHPPLKVLAERESVYQVLSQTTPENTSKKYSQYSIDPKTRYRSVNLLAIQPQQVRLLYDDLRHPVKQKLQQRPRHDSISTVEQLLKWCQRHTSGYKNVKVRDFTESWRSGLALCALIHHFRPHLIDMSSLHESSSVQNQRLAFDVLQKELGIHPVMSPTGEVDKLSMVLYLTQIKDAFTALPKVPAVALHNSKSLSLSRAQSVVFFLSKLQHNSLQRRKEKLASKKVPAVQSKSRMDDETLPRPAHGKALAPPPVDAPPAPEPTAALGEQKRSTEQCYFCGKEMYLLERVSAEGKFFHRSCFSCHTCSATLRLGGYTFDANTGWFYCELHAEHLLLNAGTTHQDIEEQDPEEDGCSSDESSPSDELFFLKPTSDLPTQTPPTPTPPTPSPPTQTPPTQSPPTQRPSTQSPLTQFPSTQSPPTQSPPTQTPPTQSPPTQRPSTQSPLTQCPSTQCPPSQNLPSSHDNTQVSNAQTESTELVLLNTEGDCPVPKPRLARQAAPCSDLSSPVAKPRTIMLGLSQAAAPPEQEPHPRQSLRKLQLSAEERRELGNLQNFSADSDSDTHGMSSSCSSSSANAGPVPEKAPPDEQEEGYWSGSTASLIREKKNRNCFRRKELSGGQNRIRSKFSPWNLSSPRISRDPYLSILTGEAGGRGFAKGGAEEEEEEEEEELEEEEEEEEDDLEDPEEFELLHKKMSPSDKADLRRTRTLERRARMSEIQRFCQAQSIQRRLEEIEESYKELEHRGVKLEQNLRGEGPGDSAETIEQWIQLVHEKNALVSEESDLMVASRQLELEDKHSTLDLEYRKYMELTEKTPEQLQEEDRILMQMVEVVEMKDSLVKFLDEKRKKEMSEKEEAFSLKEAKRHCKPEAQVHWG